MPEPVARSATFKGRTGDRTDYAQLWEREGGASQCGQALIGLLQGLSDEPATRSWLHPPWGYASLGPAGVAMAAQ